MRKKGDISINVIIVAVIALMVLVVLLMIFSGKMAIFSQGTDDVTDQRCSDIENSVIVQYSTSCPTDYMMSPSGYKDVSAGYKCCVPDETSLI